MELWGQYYFMLIKSSKQNSQQQLIAWRVIPFETIISKTEMCSLVLKVIFRVKMKNNETNTSSHLTQSCRQF